MVGMVLAFILVAGKRECPEWRGSVQPSFLVWVLFYACTEKRAKLNNRESNLGDQNIEHCVAFLTKL